MNRNSRDAGLLLARVRELEQQLAEATDAVALSAHSFAVAADTAFDIIAILGPERRFTFSNAAAERCLGYDFVSHATPALELVHPDDVERVRQALRRLRAAPEARQEVECRAAHADGTWRDIQAIGVNMTEDPVIAGILFHARDITDQRSVERELAHVATRDPVTGAANRVMFVRDLERAAARSRRSGRPTAVMVLDLDGFRLVNAKSGHAAGDELLVAVSEACTSVLRTYDSVARPTTSFARLGGDEFLVLCEDVDEGVAATIAERIGHAIRERTALSNGDRQQMTASIGVWAGALPDEPERAIVEAESAMHSAKHRGGDAIVFASQDRPEAPKTRHVLARDLAAAIRNQELVLHYQPKVETVSSRLVGVEALVRWVRPTGEMVPPSEFIGVAESSGLIGELGLWVLDEACRQRAEWESAYRPTTSLLVCVNVSAPQFNAELPKLVAGVLAERGTQPHSLCLEVTESILMREVDATVAIVKEITALGVRISVDDFGTGYSSLAYLKRFPLHELKIDKSFVDGLGQPEDTAIVAAIIAMAHALGLEVIAEGVETADQAAQLSGLGCEISQGFLFSRPVPAAELEGVMATGHLPRDGDDGERRKATEIVLVVDDAPDVRQLAHVSLATVGYEVFEAASGRDALDIARRVHPTCVVVDVNMGGMSGFDVCRALRLDPATADATILMLTSANDASDKVEAYTAGADDYLTKPFAPRDLTRRVRQAIAQRASRSI